MSEKLTDDEKNYLLKLARDALNHFFKTKNVLQVSPGDVASKRLVEDRACFVTLHLNGELKGCIGSLEASRPLFQDCIHNALSAAFEDPRFMPLQPDEFSNVKISISVLTKPVPFEVTDPNDLLEKLVPKKHGLIIQRGVARATFLPVVWEQLPGKEQFLNHLSMKAGLAPDGWKDPEAKFFVYEAEEFSE